MYLHQDSAIEVIRIRIYLTTSFEFSIRLEDREIRVFVINVDLGDKTLQIAQGL